MPRLYCAQPLSAGQSPALPPGAARHVQVLRMQPGEELVLFNGEGGQWRAVIERMGRSDVQVRVMAHEDVGCEPAVPVHLAVGIPANERMDWLVEKATELGCASIQPLVTARGVLRVAGERAEKKRDHWRAIAAAACEQSGRNTVPPVHEPMALAQWLDRSRRPSAHKVVLSLAESAQAFSREGSFANRRNGFACPARRRPRGTRRRSRRRCRLRRRCRSARACCAQKQRRSPCWRRSSFVPRKPGTSRPATSSTARTRARCPAR